MILITVGTTAHFDELVREVDRLVESGHIRDEVLAQIGRGTYEPRHIKWTRWIYPIDPEYERADLVICHGGSGTVFRMLAMRKDFIAVSNPVMQDDHQADMLGALARRGWCHFCADLSRLGDMIAHRPPLKPYPSRQELPERFWSDIMPLVRRGHS